MKGGFPFAEAPSHRVRPGEVHPRPDAYRSTKLSSGQNILPAQVPRALSEDEMDALCMEAIEGATDWRRADRLKPGDRPSRN